VRTRGIREGEMMKAHLDATHFGGDLVELAVTSRHKAVQKLRRGHHKLVHQRRRDLVVDRGHLRQVDLALHALLSRVTAPECP